MEKNSLLPLEKQIKVYAFSESRNFRSPPYVKDMSLYGT